jgi:ABC-type uncharacterized transport system substrate-binding protein
VPLSRAWVVPLVLLAVAGWVGGVPVADAHPHVFVDYAVLVRFGAGGVESVEITWTFDEFTSALILRQFDKDRDGKLSPDEVRQVERGHFAETRESQYFLSARLNGAALPIATARDFSARVANGRVTYVFTVPMATPALGAGGGRLELMADDPTIYTAFDLSAQAPVRVEAPPRALTAGCEVIRDPKGAVMDFIRCDYSYRRGNR